MLPSDIFSLENGNIRKMNSEILSKSDNSLIFGNCKQSDLFTFVKRSWQHVSNIFWRGSNFFLTVTLGCWSCFMTERDVFLIYHIKNNDCYWHPRRHSPDVISAEIFFKMEKKEFLRIGSAHSEMSMTFVKKQK